MSVPTGGGGSERYGSSASARRRDGGAGGDGARQLRRRDRRAAGARRGGERGRRARRAARPHAQVLHQVHDGDDGHAVGRRGRPGGGRRPLAAGDGRALRRRRPLLRHQEGRRRLRDRFPHAGLLAELQQGALLPRIDPYPIGDTATPSPLSIVQPSTYRSFYTILF